MKALDQNLDSLQWARRPRSQAAADLIKAGAASDRRLAEIWRKHIADEVCNESGKLLHRWDGLRWVPVNLNGHMEAA